MREFRTWVAYAQQDPFPSERQQYEGALTRMVLEAAIDSMTCSLMNQIAAAMGVTAYNRPKKRKLSDYMLEVGEPKAPTRKQTPQQQWSALSSMARALTGGNAKLLEQVEMALKKGPPKEST